MDFLPKELEDIINDYKTQIEHQEKYAKCMKQLKLKMLFSYKFYAEHGDYDIEELIKIFNKYQFIKYKIIKTHDYGGYCGNYKMVCNISIESVVGLIIKHEQIDIDVHRIGQTIHYSHIYDIETELYEGDYNWMLKRDFIYRF